MREDRLAVLLLNGPNLNLLGRREPGIYGSRSLDEILTGLSSLAAELGLILDHLQSNHEGVLIDRIHAALDDGTDGILINPGGLGHRSISLADALVGVGLPYVELHLSNVHAREPFRHRSLLAPGARGVIAGLGATSYTLGLRGLVEILAERPSGAGLP